jgi:2-polyprenyl-3-methyl-5-hydroxy-6-metoxy-1,4-benzoquinol methylase
MTPFWHPLSALLLCDPPGYASRTVIRMLLHAQGSLALTYVGDRMTPTVRSGETVAVARLEGPVRVGDLVVACPQGIPDLLRVTAVKDDGALHLQGDADPAPPEIVGADDLLGGASRPRGRTTALLRVARRLRLDLGEALGRRCDAETSDAAASVREKYDAHAPFYAAAAGEGVTAALLDRLRRLWRSDGRVLVAGCGSGSETFALHRAGWRVHGVDFAPAMIDRARRSARESDLDVEFRQADLRTHEEPAGSLDGILFTSDVYSFVPRASHRVRLLTKMAGWLAPGGTIAVGLRPVRRSYDRWILTLQWLRWNAGFPGFWGDSHTRYVAPDGMLRRSFVHYFTPRRFLREVRRAGLRVDALVDGLAELSLPREREMDPR